MTQTQDRILAGLPVVVDSVTLLAQLLLFETLLAQMAAQFSLNVLWMGAIFFLACIGVYTLRKLEPAPGSSTVPDWLVSRPLRGVLGVLFSLVVLTAVADQLGFIDLIGQVNPYELGEGEAAVYFVFAPGAWLGLSLFYMAAMTLHVNVTITRGNGRYLGLALLGLIGANSMIPPLSAFIGGMMQEAGLTGPVWMALAFLFLLLLFGPPRLIYLSKQPRWPGAVSLLLLLAFTAWQMLQ